MSDQPIRLLLIEDEPAYANLLRGVLSGSQAVPFSVTHESLLQDALTRLQNESFNIILLDLSLPDSFGFETYSRVHATAPTLPIIVLTGCDDDAQALQAVREGAQDYLVKGQIDGKMLPRIVRYAIERKRVGEALRQSEGFFRLISENVTDLIAVVDPQGRRLYNSPSYCHLLGDPELLRGTDSFREIHPADRARVRELFDDTMKTGAGHCAEYRLVLHDGSVRHIESQGSAICNEQGEACKLVVVSRDITDRKDRIDTLRAALSDLKRSHEDLKAAQRQLVQSEKLEAVSTFAAGIAHEVKNPLQTIILGVDYLATCVPANDEAAATVLGEMGEAVHRADGIIRGLLEFASYNKCAVGDEDLSSVVELALRAVESELASLPVVLVKHITRPLPRLKLDLKVMKHVFINLFMNVLDAMRSGGTLVVSTSTRPVAEMGAEETSTLSRDAAAELAVVAEVEHKNAPLDEGKVNGTPTVAPAARKTSELGLTVLKKIVELYGGKVDLSGDPDTGRKFSILFRAPAHQVS